MSLIGVYDRLRDAARMDERRANEIVHAARPFAAAVLAPDDPTPDALAVTARLVSSAEAKGGSLIPAWPIRAADGSVTIELVDDWGAALAGWRMAVGDASEIDVDALIDSGERLWVGIANDVLQLYVPDPPAGTYSMVRHHALMLAAATLWLGPERTRLWRQAHTLAARGFLSRLGGRSLDAGITDAEHGLTRLLADRRGNVSAEQALRWLDADADAARDFLQFHGAASLGIVALLERAPDDGEPSRWLHQLVMQEHPQPAFNHDWIAELAERI